MLLHSAEAPAECRGSCRVQRLLQSAEAPAECRGACRVQRLLQSAEAPTECRKAAGPTDLALAKGTPGCLYDGGLKAQAGCNVEGIGAARHAPQQAVGRRQFHLIKLHAGILKGAVLKLEGGQGAA